ncbi:hypothetical protein EK904_002519 [Melospiza melodia maxima]|nr:hypothetical protein EK904_002519 [Melospiza melodia maxima]
MSRSIGEIRFSFDFVQSVALSPSTNSIVPSRKPWWSFLMENYYSPEPEGCLVLRGTGRFFPLLSPAIVSTDLASQAIRDGVSLLCLMRFTSWTGAADQRGSMALTPLSSKEIQELRGD